MLDPIISPVVEEFALRVYRLQKSDLDLAWQWEDYEEGIRFAILRTCEQLLDMAVELGAQRISAASMTVAQRILSQYHRAFRDLQAVVIAADDLMTEKEPEPGAWSLKTTLLHIVEAERAFFAYNDYGLQRIRSNDGRPEHLSDEGYENYWRGDHFDELLEKGKFSEILAYYSPLHLRITTEFASIRDTETDVLVHFWESNPMPLRFRLGRFASHLRQHTIQIENALTTLGFEISESQRLLRLVYNSLAEAEGQLIGSPELLVDQRRALAGDITARGAEIASLLSSSD